MSAPFRATSDSPIGQTQSREAPAAPCASRRQPRSSGTAQGGRACARDRRVTKGSSARRVADERVRGKPLVRHGRQRTTATSPKRSPAARRRAGECDSSATGAVPAQGYTS